MCCGLMVTDCLKPRDRYNAVSLCAFTPLSMPKSTAWLALCLLLLFSIVFYVYPQLDLSAGRYFYHQDAGFVWAHSQWAMMIRHVLYVLVYLVCGISILVLLLKLCRVSWCRLPTRVAALVVFSFALGPGLLVNAVLKNHWGRPRPYQVQQFHGHAVFQKPWVISNQCNTNCSFVCGDASAAFAFWALLPLFRRRRARVTYGLAVLGFGLCIGLLRMAQGGHFLSDVLLSGCLVYLVTWLGHWWLYRKHNLKEGT